MKATLEFSLPEENAEHRLAVHAGALFSVLSELDGNLRNALKHGHLHKTADDALEFTRQTIHDELASHGINMEMFS